MLFREVKGIMWGLEFPAGRRNMFYPHSAPAVAVYKIWHFRQVDSLTCFCAHWIHASISLLLCWQMFFSSSLCFMSGICGTAMVFETPMLFTKWAVWGTLLVLASLLLQNSVVVSSSCWTFFFLTAESFVDTQVNWEKNLIQFAVFMTDCEIIVTSGKIAMCATCLFPLAAIYCKEPPCRVNVK